MDGRVLAAREEQEPVAVHELGGSTGLARLCQPRLGGEDLHLCTACASQHCIPLCTPLPP